MSRQIINWLPRFEGNDTENPMEWVEDFESLADMSGTPKNDLLHYLRFYLTGRARMWHRTIARELKTWEQFRTLFDARYKSEEINLFNFVVSSTILLNKSQTKCINRTTE
ncbi:unnamed protein product [Umbelopsis ramanniana]